MSLLMRLGRFLRQEPPSVTIAALGFLSGLGGRLGPPHTAAGSISSPENQIRELRRYVAARGWEAREFVEHGVSGTTDRRPALDALLAEVRRRRVEVVVCWKLDRIRSVTRVESRPRWPAKLVSQPCQNRVAARSACDLRARIVERADRVWFWQ